MMVLGLYILFTCLVAAVLYAAVEAHEPNSRLASALKRIIVAPRPFLKLVAKAALESAVRYIAAELGPKGIRVHAISPGPLATRAASGIPEFDALLDKAKAKAPARSLVSIDDVGVATAFLAHDAARLITGETLYIDRGYHIMD